MRGSFAIILGLLLAAIVFAGWRAATATPKPRCRWRPSHRDTLTESISGQWINEEGFRCR